MMASIQLAPAGVEHVSLADGHLAYRDVGSGRPLVLLHGGGVDHRMWNQQIETFAAEYRVIAPDARGHGRSATPVGPFRRCDDLAALLNHLDLGPVTLIGVSLGAGTAVDTALEHPHLVRSLVISGTGTSEPEFHDPWTLGILETWRRTHEAGDAEGWIDAFMLFAAGPHRDLLASIGGLDADDHIGMAERETSHGSAVTIEGTAHYPNMERPAEFNAGVARFLRESR